MARTRAASIGSCPTARLGFSHPFFFEVLSLKIYTKKAAKTHRNTSYYSSVSNRPTQLSSAGSNLIQIRSGADLSHPSDLHEDPDCVHLATLVDQQSEPSNGRAKPNSPPAPSTCPAVSPPAIVWLLQSFSAQYPPCQPSPYASNTYST